MGSYLPTSEEAKAYHWCINNGIFISPFATGDATWYIDIEINNKEATIRRILIYPYKPLPRSKDSYAILLKAINPRRSGLYQFHSYVQYAGEESSRYLGSWTILID